MYNSPRDTVKKDIAENFVAEIVEQIEITLIDNTAIPFPQIFTVTMFKYKSPEPLIIVRLVGGLGNQMFQYATALSLGQHWRCPVKVDIRAYKAGRKRSYLLDQIQHAPVIASEQDIALFEGVSSTLQKHLHRFISGRELARKTYRQPGYCYDTGLAKLQPPLFLQKGYFQSEKFFLPYAETVRGAFRLKNPIPEKSQIFLSAIKSSPRPVAVHIRRGDYLDPTQKTHSLCTRAYYEKAANIINDRNEKKVTWFVFSDDIPAARSILSFLPDPTFVTGHENKPWVDMILMATCRDAIIANSSFSWWGAWLNSNRDKTIVAPRLWFYSEKNRDISDLIPSSWISL